MGNFGFIILVLMLVAIANTNFAIEAKNVKLEETKVVQQYPKTSSSELFHVAAAWYHTMPKGDHHPPSGPSHGLTPDPPGPPPTRYNS
ncbi:hypothetical protein AgCh_010583 [Apium graveolens]